ncbi:MAG TPA: pantoate--beta-alanine ligase [Eudoraea sp.]|nr:pantoate--beta-alanine ligase [Eudoraea sp.]
MQTFRTKKNLNVHLGLLRSKNYTIGLVPTMGALHLGHLALVRRAVAQNSYVVVSIFVNPTQFNNREDLKEYPKAMDRDRLLLQSISDEIILFSPSVSEIYAGKVHSKKYNFEGLDEVMEGEFREGHFDGVGTIVEKLLTIVSPHRAYFGEKDFQQLQIIRKLVESLGLPVEIISCPIVREGSGLAMSSRNERLSERLRKEAAFIYKTLKEAKVQFGTKSAKYVTGWVRQKFSKHPDLSLEYIRIMNAASLRPVLRKEKGQKYRAFIAVYAEGVRLIDNIALN